MSHQLYIFFWVFTDRLEIQHTNDHEGVQNRFD
jgi:hypothetical protein